MDHTKLKPNFNELIRTIQTIAQQFDAPTDANLTPPEDVVQQARQGLDWHNALNRGGTSVGRGGTSVALMRAIELARRTPMTPATIKQMRNFFSRNKKLWKNKNKDLPNGQPTNAKIAWALWGGDAAKKWVETIQLP